MKHTNTKILILLEASDNEKTFWVIAINNVK